MSLISMREMHTWIFCVRRVTRAERGGPRRYKESVAGVVTVLEAAKVCNVARVRSRSGV